MASIKGIFAIQEEIYRGVKGLDAQALKRLVNDASPEGVTHAETELSSDEHPWWTTRPGLAMVYAGTKNVSGRGDDGYDVMLVSSEPLQPSGTGGIVDLSKKKPIRIVADRIAWVPSSLPFEKKKARLFQLLGVR